MAEPALAPCPGCGRAVSSRDDCCPGCGLAFDSATGTAPRPLAPTPPPPTRTPTPGPRSGPGSQRAPAAVPLHSSGAAGPRFEPGAVLAGRYRIVSMLGRGAMGEVYRADDLTLGQAVALKFLPEALRDDEGRRERFLNEVRTARRIAHPAVCRVYDVDEVDGHPFLSMEYVDGEDLTSLTRRIGRLPTDKALDVARQIAAGLAAAHDQGVLHRDLKPDNVMLDGRGKARITDFGLAAVADAVPKDDVRSGTPAYMSPEQLAGREVTTASDIYALGLVLYELFTGRRPFEGRTWAELRRQHEELPPPHPTALVPELDPAIERVVLRCLEKEAARRPPNALAVAAALPGGDPLAAALAAGETPSPELVAAAGQGREVLRARWAWACLAFVAAVLLVVPSLSRQNQLLRLVPLEKAPAVLEDRARALLARFGDGIPAADRYARLAPDEELLRWIGEKDTSANRWERLAGGDPPVVLYAYRESPRVLIPLRQTARVGLSDPPLTVSGMRNVYLDTQGRLEELYAVPSQVEPAEPTSAAPDWAGLLTEAGFDPLKVQETRPEWTPPHYADARKAWTATYPGRPDLPLRIEAAAYRGKPVYFQVVGPWTKPARMEVQAPARGADLANRAVVAILLCVVLASAVIARRNVLLGRGDRRGALRLAVLTVFTLLLAWALSAHHVPQFWPETMMLINALAGYLVAALMVWVLYLALEPYVRRHAPESLVAWTRLLTHGVGDPVVGRDLLVGVAAGSLGALLFPLVDLIPGWLGLPASRPSLAPFEALLGTGQAVAVILGNLVESLSVAMILLLLLLLLRHRLPEWAAAAIFMTLFGVQPALRTNVPLLFILPLTLLTNGGALYLLLRLGLLSAATGLFVTSALLELPLNPDLSHWSAGPTWVALLTVGGLAVHAFRTAQRGQPIFGRALLGD